MTEFGEVLLRLMESRGLRGPADLARLMRGAGHDVSEYKITALVEGEEWVDGHFPRRVAEVLESERGLPRKETEGGLGWASESAWRSSHTRSG